MSLVCALHELYQENASALRDLLDWLLEGEYEYADDASPDIEAWCNHNDANYPGHTQLVRQHADAIAAFLLEIYFEQPDNNLYEAVWQAIQDNEADVLRDICRLLGDLLDGRIDSDRLLEAHAAVAPLQQPLTAALTAWNQRLDALRAAATRELGAEHPLTRLLHGNLQPDTFDVGEVPHVV